MKYKVVNCLLKSRSGHGCLAIVNRRTALICMPGDPQGRAKWAKRAQTLCFYKHSAGLDHWTGGGEDPLVSWTAHSSGLRTSCRPSWVREREKETFWYARNCKALRKYWVSIRKVSGTYLWSIRQVSGKHQESIDELLGKCPVSIRKVFMKYSESIQ